MIKVEEAKRSDFVDGAEDDERGVVFMVCGSTKQILIELLALRDHFKNHENEDFRLIWKIFEMAGVMDIGLTFSDPIDLNNGKDRGVA